MSTSSPQSFMLLFRNAGPESHRHLTPEQQARLTREWNDWYDGLAARKQVLQGQPLALEGRVIANVQGRIVDGPYAETKEAIGGYFILQVADLAEATAIGRQCPGLPHGVVVEVRPLAGRSPVLEGVRGRPPAAHG